MAYQSNIRTTPDAVLPAMRAAEDRAFAKEQYANEMAAQEAEASRAAQQRAAAQQAGGMMAAGDDEGARNALYGAGDLKGGMAIENQMAERSEREDKRSDHDREVGMEFVKATGNVALGLLSLPPEQRAEAAKQQMGIIANVYPGHSEDAFEMLALAQSNNYSDEALRAYAKSVGAEVEKKRKLMSLGGGDVAVFEDGEMVDRIKGDTGNELAEYEAKKKIDAKYRPAGSTSSGGVKTNRYKVMGDGRVFDTATGEFTGEKSEGGASNDIFASGDTKKKAEAATAPKLQPGMKVRQGGHVYEIQADGSSKRID